MYVYVYRYIVCIFNKLIFSKLYFYLVEFNCVNIYYVYKFVNIDKN